MAQIQNTGEADVELFAGGTYSTGPSKGVYHVRVVEHEKGRSKGDPNNVNKKTGKKEPKLPRPYLGLVLEVTKKDKFHVSKHGKKLLTDRTYFGLPEDDVEKRNVMAGMVKRKLFDGFKIPWNKESKKITGQLFIEKEAFVWLDEGKDEGGSEEKRVQVQAVSQTAEKLPKVAQAWLAEMKANGAESTVEPEVADAAVAEDKPAPATRRR